MIKLCGPVSQPFAIDPPSDWSDGASIIRVVSAEFPKCTVHGMRIVVVDSLEGSKEFVDDQWVGRAAHVIDLRQPPPMGPWFEFDLELCEEPKDA